MKTFQQFNEDAAAQYRAGQLAYQSSASARLADRRATAAERSRTLASDFVTRSKQKMQADKERTQTQSEDLHLEQTPTMEPNEYNKQIARHQATQKSAHITHVHRELGAEARAQQAQKRAEMKAIMSR